MEKKNYIFRAFDSRNHEINMNHSMEFYGITHEEANTIRMGIRIGLMQKYKDPYIIYEVKY